MQHISEIEEEHYGTESNHLKQWCTSTEYTGFQMKSNNNLCKINLK